MAGNEFTSIIKVIERENALDQDLHDNAVKVFGKEAAPSVQRTLQNGINRRNDAIAILTKAAEPELEYFHGYYENGMGASRCSSKENAEAWVRERGGMVLSRPKPEPFTVVVAEEPKVW